MKDSGKSLVKGVFKGVTGIFTKPVQEAKKAGKKGFGSGVKGFGKGLLKGITGVVVKPI